MKDATELDLRHSRRVTAALGRSNVPKVLQVLGQMHRQEVEANVFHYSAGIHTCEKANEWQTAILLLQQMLDHRIAPDAVVCNATMSVLEKSSQWHTALDLMVQLAWLVVEADTISFNSALSGLAASKNWRDAMHLAQVMDYTGVAPSSITSNSLIDALEHWPRALQLLKQLPQRRRTLVTYNSLISACGPSDPSGRSWTQGPGAEPNGPMQSAWPLAASFLSMSSLQVQPDVISYNATISACEKSCEWRLPLHLLQHLDADVVADVVSCSGAICACQKAWRACSLSPVSLQNSRAINFQICPRLGVGTPADVEDAALPRGSQQLLSQQRHRGGRCLAQVSSTGRRCGRSGELQRLAPDVDVADVAYGAACSPCNASGTSAAQFVEFQHCVDVLGPMAFSVASHVPCHPDGCDWLQFVAERSQVFWLAQRLRSAHTHAKSHSPQLQLCNQRL
ncbi:unnamed protein product [Cladocopium goreaui]|uniref:Pentatricopeptide repeat-containing protein, chloroplastic n=1 Tax=Cladocopium goreaui TaxID=2562237 RepID=A0A9P1D2X4_9DINO|nr:unnamed protein product [Cladocopium goreaui]